MHVFVETYIKRSMVLMVSSTVIDSLSIEIPSGGLETRYFLYD